METGEIFVLDELDRAVQYTESRIGEIREEIGVLTGQEGELNEEMEKLKVKLYAKFGDKINLEKDGKRKK